MESPNSSPLKLVRITESVKNKKIIFTIQIISGSSIEKLSPYPDAGVKFWAKADKIRGGGERYKISFVGGERWFFSDLQMKSLTIGKIKTKVIHLC